MHLKNAIPDNQLRSSAYPLSYPLSADRVQITCKMFSLNR